MATEVLTKPLITEKGTKLNDKLNTYVFKVARGANKLEIQKAVEQYYNVQVSGVNTAVIPGKSKSRYTKKGLAKGMKAAYKKAFVTLKEGQVIDFYGNV
ncbi:MAG: 50S ribosomal protein L23 [Chitinophagales bacterium]|nr:50S ribosomal protein L23 [Chitinophagales bacterium]MCO5280922.1 50S ribosomal protein L23 [Chitinophagales bacterium]OJV27532.1 MAG: 50S ribosomal protein L23 [Bacteroidetes bacterium 37-13]HRN95060.1 50S ribosomal protein L23 [Chitinophagales bacterium]HRP39626.1 50S ribosomal protein L23 [Chitinophagales bacterium]